MDSERALGVAEVRAFLEPRGLSVRELPSDTSTAVLAAQALGTPVGTIVKSLLFIVDDEPVLVLVAGDRKLNAKELRRELQVQKVRLATRDEVVSVTGYEIGGVPPVAHRHQLKVLIDGHLLEHPTVYAAACAGNALFGCAPAALVDMTGGELTGAAS